MAACPVSAMFTRPDGIVDFDRDRCIGCAACMAACPYDAIYINPDNHSAEKCNFCAHRIDQGREPACVAVCPTQAIIVGDANDPNSKVSTILARQNVEVRRPEKATRPSLFYVDAHQLALIPAGPNGYQMATELAEGDRPNNARRRGGVALHKTSAAALISYGGRHVTPWDWRVSAYTWTKSIASGMFLALAILLLVGDDLGQWWSLSVATVSLVFLGMTGIILVAHLTHPLRFLYIIRWPQWRSWLTRGAYILLLFGALTFAFVVSTALEMERTSRALLWPGAVAATMTAIYTAFLLGQAKGRDFWQNPLLPLRFFLHAGLAGFAAIYLMTALNDIDSTTLSHIEWGLASTIVANLGLSIAELSMPHATESSAMAAHELLWGRYRWQHWLGVAAAEVLAVTMVSVGLAFGVAEFIHAAGAFGLVGLALLDHAHIQAGQSVPQS